MTRATGPFPGRAGTTGPADEDPLARAVAAAMKHVAAGSYDEAVRAVEAGGRAVVNHPVGRNLLGNIYLEQGRQREALRAFEAAAKSAPGFPDAHCNRGVVLQLFGRHDEALAAFDRALQLRPAYPLAHFNRGNLLAALGRSGDAVAAYDAAVRLQPKFAEAYLNRGHAFLKNGRPIDALNDFDRALAQRFGYREALLGRAQALLALRRPEEALAVVQRLLDKDSADIGALSIKASVLDKLARFADALTVLAELLAHDPTNVEALGRRSATLKELRRFDESLADAEACIALAPASHHAHFVRALALGELDRLEEALQEIARAEELGAPLFELNWNRAILLGRLGRLAEAGLLYEKALAEKPDDLEVRTAYAHALLLLGEFERGWDEYEHRLLKPDFEQKHLVQLAPRWRGEDIRGKRLLVYQEQGFGDAIQFVRYVRRLAAFEAEVTLIVTGKALLPILKASLPGMDVTDVLGMRRGFDRQVSLVSLPFIFRTRLDSVPNEVPYLSADPARVEKWRSRLSGGGLKVGLCWHGNPKFPRDHLRSVPLAAFAPLSSIPGVRLFSLQAIHGLDQLEHLPPGMQVETLGPETGSATDGLAEIAAIMANLDLVVSVDSAIAHLAGALAVPVWTAIRAEPEWRWLQDREDSPWYPTMRLFRQAKIGDWSDVVARMAEELKWLRVA